MSTNWGKSVESSCDALFVCIPSSSLSGALLAPLLNMAEGAWDQHASYFWLRCSPATSIDPITAAGHRRSANGAHASGEGETLIHRLACLPGEIWLQRGDCLYRRGASVPTRYVPSLNWTPLAELCRLILPRPGITSRIPPAHQRELRLIPSNQPWDAAGLLAAQDSVAAWIDKAPVKRIESLQWCVRGKECLLLGRPLPPLQGVYFVERQQILTPCGFEWTPKLKPSDVRLVFQVRDEEWIFWQSDTQIDLIPETAMRPLNRGAFRLWLEQTHPEPADE